MQTHNEQQIKPSQLVELDHHIRQIAFLSNGCLAIHDGETKIIVLDCKSKNKLLEIKAAPRCTMAPIPEGKLAIADETGLRIFDGEKQEITSLMQDNDLTILCYNPVHKALVCRKGRYNINNTTGERPYPTEAVIRLIDINAPDISQTVLFRESEFCAFKFEVFSWKDLFFAVGKKIENNEQPPVTGDHIEIFGKESRKSMALQVKRTHRDSLFAAHENILIVGFEVLDSQGLTTSRGLTYIDIASGVHFDLELHAKLGDFRDIARLILLPTQRHLLVERMINRSSFSRIFELWDFLDCQLLAELPFQFPHTYGGSPIAISPDLKLFYAELTLKKVYEINNFWFLSEINSSHIRCWDLNEFLQLEFEVQHQINQTISNTLAMMPSALIDLIEQYRYSTAYATFFGKKPYGVQNETGARFTARRP